MKWLHFPDAHEEDRFEEIYEKYYQTVYNYVYRILLHRQNTEDVVSETFLKAMRAFSRYDRKKGTVSVWLCGIAHNCAMDLLRAAAVRTSLSLEELLENENIPESVRNEWEDNTAEWEAWEILRRLSVQERTLLNWRYFLGLSNREIAQKLGITEKAASKRIIKTLAKCRDIAAEASVF